MDKKYQIVKKIKVNRKDGYTIPNNITTINVTICSECPCLEYHDGDEYNEYKSYHDCTLGFITKSDMKIIKDNKIYGSATYSTDCELQEIICKNKIIKPITENVEVIEVLERI